MKDRGGAKREENLDDFLSEGHRHDGASVQKEPFLVLVPVAIRAVTNDISTKIMLWEERFGVVEELASDGMLGDTAPRSDEGVKRVRRVQRQLGTIGRGHWWVVLDNQTTEKWLVLRKRAHIAASWCNLVRSRLRTSRFGEISARFFASNGFFKAFIILDIIFKYIIFILEYPLGLWCPQGHKLALLPELGVNSKIHSGVRFGDADVPCCLTSWLAGLGSPKKLILCTDSAENLRPRRVLLPEKFFQQKSKFLCNMVVYIYLSTSIASPPAGGAGGSLSSESRNGCRSSPEK